MSNSEKLKMKCLLNEFENVSLLVPKKPSVTQMIEYLIETGVCLSSQVKNVRVSHQIDKEIESKVH